MGIEEKKRLAIDHLRAAQDKLEAARILFENDKFDESISRAYYSVFHSLKALLVLAGLEAKTHKGVYYSFYKEFVEKNIFPRDMYKKIAQLQHNREDADYGVIGEVFDEQEASEALHIANFVRNFAEKYVKGKQEGE